MNSKQKNILIGGLLAIVLILGVAYAAFQSQLNITGTSTIDSKWDVRITSITPDKKATNSGTEASPNYTTAGDISHSITNNDLTANFAAGLVSPGDSVVYTIKVKNNGTLNAALNTLTKTPSTNPAITFEVSGIEQNDILNAGAEKEFTVTVAYANVEEQPTSTSASFSLTLDFVQTNESSSGSGLGPQSETFTGAIYRWSETELAISGSDYDDGENSSIAKLTNGIDYITETDYETYNSRANKLGHQYYLKHIIVNNLVTDSYVCFITDNEYCMQGGINEEELESKPIYTTNKGILESNENWFKSANPTGSCSDEGSYFRCGGGVFHDINAYDEGSVSVMAPAGVACGVDGFGDSECGTFF